MYKFITLFMIIFFCSAMKHKGLNNFSISLGFKNQKVCEANLQAVAKEIKQQLKLKDLIAECVEHVETEDYGITFYTSDNHSPTFFGAKLTGAYAMKDLEPHYISKTYKTTVNKNNLLVSENQKYESTVEKPLVTIATLRDYKDCLSKIELMHFENYCIGDLKLFKMCLENNNKSSLLYACVE